MLINEHRPHSGQLQNIYILRYSEIYVVVYHIQLKISQFSYKLLCNKDVCKWMIQIEWKHRFHYFRSLTPCWNTNIAHLTLFYIFRGSFICQKGSWTALRISSCHF